MTERPTPLWLQRWFQLLLGSLVLLTVASLVVPWLLGLVYALRSVLLPLVIALGLAYIFNPVVTWANQKLRLPRSVGTAGVMLVGLIVAMILALVVLPPLVAQGVELINKAKSYPEQISRLVQEQAAKHKADPQTPPSGDTSATDASPESAEAVPEIADGAGTAVAQTQSDGGEKTTGETTANGGIEISETAGSTDGILNDLRVVIEDALGPERATEMLAGTADWLSQMDWGQVAQFLLTSLDVGVGVVGSAISITSYFALSAIIIGFCFFFFSWKLDKLTAWFVPFIPVQHKTEVLGVVVMMDKSVAAFIRGRLIQAGVMSVILSIGWWMAGVPSWLLLGVLSGLLNLVPFAAVVGFLAAVVLALVDSVAGGGFTIWVLIWPTVVYILAQGLDGWVVEPIVQGKATDLDPVSVLLAVMIGGALAGLLGMLIAIPAAACIKILSRQVVLPRLRVLAGSDTPTRASPQ
jgi:predicted PurR-regulated permease PerM